MNMFSYIVPCLYLNSSNEIIENPVITVQPLQNHLFAIDNHSWRKKILSVTFSYFADLRLQILSKDSNFVEIERM